MKMEVFVTTELQTLIDNVIQYYDDTFTSRRQVAEFIIQTINIGFIDANRKEIKKVIPKKSERIKLKPLTIHQK